VHPTLRSGLRKYNALRQQFDAVLLGDESDIFERELRKCLAKRPSFVPAKKGSRVFILNPQPFVPAEFLGLGWSLWLGPANGSGIEGRPAIDERSLALSEVDVASIRFENMLNEEDGEISVRGEEKILRLKTAKFIRLDARLGRDLLAEPKHETLVWLYRERGITGFDLPGTVLRDPNGNRYVPCLYRNERRWNWNANWLENDWNRSNPSAVQASHFISPPTSFREEFCFVAILWKLKKSLFSQTALREAIQVLEGGGAF